MISLFRILRIRRKCMFRQWSVWMIIGMVVVGMLAVGSDAAELNPTPENPVTFRLAYTDNASWPETAKIPEPEHANALIFKSYVETATNGAVMIELYPSSSFASNKEATEMVKAGTLDLCIETGVMGGFFPEYQVINIPYVFRSPEVAWWVFDNSQFWQDLMDQMEAEIGMVCLGMGQNGVRHFTNNTRPIHEPKDMEGIKFRVMQSPIFVKTVEALGAKAIPIAWGELYTSLQTGVIDGQENPISVITFVGKLYEVQEYMTLDGHTWSENMLLMNAATFRSLPENIQQIFRIAGKHAAQADRAAEGLMSRILGMNVLKEHIQIYAPTPEQITLFQQKAQPPVVDWLKEQVGADVVDGFLEAVKEAEVALGYE
ncbi:DctP family TRAP transporter solute-binding subunit [candidate division KSB3 bacterium]|uniref:DctP family TRAP transporter solute-binding subunit n=1 Tax=candidate division KSB3 bacterium TaxID=2044937 RepID=A0A9D5Q4S4_9BACT|nr:DctP family TRAP transporter solute-binding subunit [candidate division KSB3 bacterium]MBD3323487.1 DctP family TRAP transporter solute-binding subunit [candidate division KSB3 bacterium]